MGEINGEQGSQFMLLSCSGREQRSPRSLSTEPRQPFGIGVVFVKAGLEASGDD